MFDFSFGELAVIGAVALVVLGPEKLPKVARTTGQWIGKAQRYVNDIKADIQREAELAELKKLQEQVQASAREIETSVHEHLGAAQHALDDATRIHEGGPVDVSTTTAESHADETIAAWHDTVKPPPPTNEELAARLADMQRQLAAGAGPRFKYAPRARAARGRVARRTHTQTP